MKLIQLISTLILIALPLQGYCARPMVTDDARIVDPKSCQLESWTKVNRGSSEFWALPGCNFGENFEITYGGAVTRDNSETHKTDTLLQAKTLLRKLDTNGYGIGLVVGHVQQPRENTRDDLIGDAYFYVPVTFSMRDDKFLLHTNLGAIHSKADQVNRATWGVGAEAQLSESTYLIAEMYGESGSRAFHQVGLRYWIIPNRVQFDTTYGNRFANSGDEQWMTFGLRFLSSPFLP